MCVTNRHLPSRWLSKARPPKARDLRTNTQSGMPVNALRASSRTPRQTCNSALASATSQGNTHDENRDCVRALEHKAQPPVPLAGFSCTETTFPRQEHPVHACNTVMKATTDGIAKCTLLPWLQHPCRCVPLRSSLPLPLSLTVRIRRPRNI